MIKCEKAREWLPLLDFQTIDGPYTRNRVKLKEHLEQCPDCRKYLHNQTELRRILSQAGEVELSEGYIENFAERLSERLASGKTSQGWLQSWFHRLEASPLPTLTLAAALVWVIMILALQFPGVGPAVLQMVGR